MRASFAKRIVRGAVVLSPALVLAVAAHSAAAQQYPDRPIRVIIPVAPGLSTNDVIPRAVGRKLAEALGQPLVMDNRAGASGQIGTSMAAKAAPDGYTMLVGYTTTLAVRPNIVSNPGYDPDKDLDPVARIFTSPSFIAIGASVSATNVKELVALAKAQPGKLIFGSAGSGSTPHLCGELFQLVAGIRLSHVAYKSAGAAITALAAGEAHVVCQAAGSLMPLIRAGKVRAVLAAAPARVATLPDVPTSAEAGLPEFQVESWSGLMVPAGTPPAIVSRLHAEIARIVATPDIQSFIRKQGAEPALLDPAAFDAYIRSERAKWAKVVKAANLKVN